MMRELGGPCPAQHLKCATTLSIHAGNASMDHADKNQSWCKKCWDESDSKIKRASIFLIFLLPQTPIWFNTTLLLSSFIFRLEGENFQNLAFVDKLVFLLTGKALFPNSINGLSFL